MKEMEVYKDREMLAETKKYLSKPPIDTYVDKDIHKFEFDIDKLDEMTSMISVGVDIYKN